ncbi:MAG: tetratricopeptide repeat protein [Oscillospiraceae bacterium]|nr:tetratricopeptide repeat protein [Oscillospiraceae bacterium]
MRKILLLSGLFTVILLSMSLTGFTDKDDSVKEAMWLGNQKYELGAFDEALKLYESGLEINPDDGPLNFNAAQAAYLLGEYSKAEEYYGKSGDNIERFLNVGNIYAALGDSLDENEQKLQCYLQALKYYQEGIIMFPQNVPLKFNYEIVKGKADDISSDMDQQDSDSQDNDESDSDDSQEQNEQEQEGQEQDNQEQDGQEQDSQEQDSQEQDSQEQDGQEQEGQEQDNQEQEGQEQEQAQGQEQEEGEEDGQDANSLEENEIDLDMEAIERILKMLEIQEEESLKNNQEVVGGKNGKNGW